MVATEHSIAEALYQAEQSQQPIAPIRELLAEAATVDQAYPIQDINTQRALHQGRRIVGKKIGLTSFAVQQQLGVDSPDFGMLFDDMAYDDGQEIPFSK